MNLGSTSIGLLAVVGMKELSRRGPRMMVWNSLGIPIVSIVLNCFGKYMISYGMRKTKQLCREDPTLPGTFLKHPPKSDLLSNLTMCSHGNNSSKGFLLRYLSVQALEPSSCQTTRSTA